ncbi:MAG: 1-(5-phosphoribosyl)-5-[(5-phosphoribosylamino)methylideneamino]imidazole-4-carboxamide isomerase [Thermomicrobiaceae bacterium]
MLIIPAIDLREGRCVRLFQGDFDKETSYSDDPTEVARRWQNSGARRLHIVDLDGARAGEPVQLEIVSKICQLGVPVQLGGGLRQIDHVRAAVEAGVDRVILGTAAIENPELMRESVDAFGSERVVLGVDARNGYVALRGWEQMSGIPAIEIIEDALNNGIERVIYTDIDRDGTLNSPNFDETARVAAIGPAIIASGGVARWDDLWHLSRIRNVEAAIVGRALYDGTIEIKSGDRWQLGQESVETGGA